MCKKHMHKAWVVNLKFCFTLATEPCLMLAQCMPWSQICTLWYASPNKDFKDPSYLSWMQVVEPAVDRSPIGQATRKRSVLSLQYIHPVQHQWSLLLFLSHKQQTRRSNHPSLLQQLSGRKFRFHSIQEPVSNVLPLLVIYSYPVFRCSNNSGEASAKWLGSFPLNAINGRESALYVRASHKECLTSDPKSAV